MNIIVNLSDQEIAEAILNYLSLQHMVVRGLPMRIVGVSESLPKDLSIAIEPIYGGAKKEECPHILSVLQGTMRNS